MKQLKKSTKYTGIYRRSFLKIAGLSTVGLSLGLPFCAKDKDIEDTVMSKTFVDWRTDENGNKYFIPKNIRTDLVNNQKIVSARVDRKVRNYKIREFNEEFHDWWIDERTWYCDQLIAFIEGKKPQFNIPNGGHHHPMLSTYGRTLGRRGDSDFHLNTAVKGFTLIPKIENMQYINNEIKKVYKSGKIPVDILKVKQQLYKEKDLWDKTRFATLELFSGRPINTNDPEGSYGFIETHTFQNLVVNPMATLTYMSIFNTDGTQSYFEGLPNLTPNFEFRGFCWLISRYNPNNTAYENTIAEYVNHEYSRWHGRSSDVTTNLFLISEEFNNTPYYGPGRGKRVIPEQKYQQQSKRKVIKSNGKNMLAKEERIELVKNLNLLV